MHVQDQSRAGVQSHAGGRWVVITPVPGRVPATTTAKERTSVAPPTVVAEPVPLSDPPAWVW